jgi:hypothetical protein
MNTIRWKYKYDEIRASILRLFNKELVVFLGFVLISAVFWLTTTLNDTYETEVEVPLTLSDVPKRFVITQDLPPTVKVTIKDKGFVLLNYLYYDKLPKIVISFPVAVKTKNKDSISTADIQKILKSTLVESTHIISVKADHWDFFFNRGKTKVVPIVVDGEISPAPNYYITKIDLKPDSVTIFAADAAFDTINVAYTENVNITNIETDTYASTRLRNIRGVKFGKTKVAIDVYIDQLTEVEFNVPVQPINLPDNVFLKTFPSHVKVKVAVGLKRSHNIKPEQFIVVADYNDINISDPRARCTLKLQSIPKGIVRASIVNPHVDYIIETLKGTR